VIKVLVVDDSSFMRNALIRILRRDPELEVVGSAADGLDAIEAIKRLDPDVVTLDVEMPRMDGLTALQHIMRDLPRPVLMVSALTSHGAETTLKALDAGAVDFVGKPGSGSTDIAAVELEICQKVKAVSRHRKALALRAKLRTLPADSSTALKHRPSPVAQPFSSREVTPVIRPSGRRQTRDFVAIGVSTGGPPAVQKVLSAFPEDFPAPILIAQHMPASFTGPFADRLNSICKISVKEAEDGEKAREGCAYVCPGGRHIRISSKLSSRTIVISENPKEALYKPSATELMASVGEQIGSRALGVILTGMGSDGATGVEILKRHGGRALAQSEATCVVYGMPKAIVDARLADEVVDLDDIAAAIMDNLHK